MSREAIYDNSELPQTPRRKTNIVPYTEQDFKETNGDKVRKVLSKLSDYKISHLEFCNLYEECEECPMNGMEKCMGTARERQLWLKQEAQSDA